MAKKTVLFFVSSNTGGAERMTITIAKLLPDKDYIKKFVIVNRTIGNIVNFIPKEYEIIHIPIRNIYCFTTFRMIWQIIWHKADVVFASNHYLNVRVAMAAKLTGTKSVLRCNTGLYRTGKSIVRLVKFTYPFADRIIAQQEEMYDELLAVSRVSPNRVRVLHNPLDVESIQKKSSGPSPYADDDAVNYVCVGRADDPVKGQDVLIKAFSIVKKNNSNAQLFIVGAFDEKKEFCKKLIKFIQQENLQSCVHLVGFDANPYRWMKNANCFVLPSRQEGLPNALIESQYLGTPVVATRCVPVIDRIVDNGSNGYTCESENPLSIANAMQKAIRLTKVTMTYCPATAEDFIELFK